MPGNPFWLRMRVLSGDVRRLDATKQLSQAAEEQVATALQAYTSAMSAPRAAVQPGTALLPLRLSELCWSHLQTPAVLLAVHPLQHLTKLCLTHVEAAALTPAVLVAVECFSGLQELHMSRLSSYFGRQLLPSTVWDSVGALSRLTALKLQGVAAMPELLLKLPASLQGLTVLSLYDEELMQDDYLPACSLEHLSCLTTVRLNFRPSVAFEILAFPGTLAEASLVACPFAALPPGLHSLALEDPEGCPEVLEQLPQLQQLRQLSLFVDCTPEGGDFYQHEEWHIDWSAAWSVCHVASKLTQLTCLHMDMQDWYMAGCSHPVPVVDVVAALTGLQELMLLHGWFMCDALKLSCLTNLTHLSLAYCGPGVDDDVAVALACSLTNLVSLDVSCCGLFTQAVLPAAARLTRLTQLKLHGTEGEDSDYRHQELVVDEAGLFMLTSLRGLRELSIPANHSVSQAALQRFVDVMPHLTCVDALTRYGIPISEQPSSS